MEQFAQQHQERLRQITVLEESSFKYKLSHWVVRLIATVNSADMILGTFLPAYYQIVRQLHLDHPVVIYWYGVSSLLLPVYVVIQAWWILKTASEVQARRELKAILIDAIFAATWFVILWSIALYTLTHTVWL